jgi:thymidylate synthase (FAD)
MTNQFESICRITVPELDQILGKPLKVLDDGFVRVIDYMGSDESIVQAARVSYGKGTKKVNQDTGLIRYLMRHLHTSPFEMCEIKLHIRTPMDCWRQWIRHRTANVNEYSTRYSIAIDATQKTGATDWRLQAQKNRQGSEGILEESQGSYFSKQEEELHEHTRHIYEERIKSGIAREQARKDLPLSTYTEAYWKIDLQNLLHFLALRMAPNAQLEIRNYANIIGNEIVSRWCPITWEAFKEYRLGTISLSHAEAEIIKAIQAKGSDEAVQVARGLGFISPEGEEIRPNLEREELEEKLVVLGIPIPWPK